MSDSPADLLSLRARFAAETGCALADIGIAADEDHLSNGGYHCGAFDLRRINAVANDDYSIRQPRDRAVYIFDLNNGRNWASAMDFPDDWPRGGRDAWIRWNNLMRQQLGIRDPALAALRGMNYTPDGGTKRRFDCLTHVESPSTDTVTWHTHLEWWRDTIGGPLRTTAANRIIQIVIAARDNIPLALAGIGDDDMFLRTPNGTIYLAAGGQTVSVSSTEWAGTSPQSFTSVPQSLVDKLRAEPATGPTAAEIAAEVVAQLPPGTLDSETILAALESDRGQAALVKAGNKAEDS
jgi:hypothetical protein